MDGLLNSFKNRWAKLFVGLFFIYLLDICVHAFSYFYITQSERNISEKKSEEINKKLI
jgi:hypothetical protein